MSRSSLIQMLTLGFAIFAMFFGAGNVVFPLVVGMETTADFPYALAGLFVTAVVVPFAGLYVAVLLDGCYRRFFTPLGRWGGALVAATILALLGPFGVIPRCIALSQATFQMYFSFGPPWVFDALACGVVFILALRPTAIVNILGKYLTPLMIAILTMIIIIGLMQAPVAQQQASITGYYAWSQGLTQGYQTMDLLAALFFASFVAGWLKQAQESSGPALWLVACG
jgi:LIVCS family branched-chain amino acid:cation transporter